MNRRDFITRGIMSSGTFGIVGSSLANQYKFGSQNQMSYHYQLPKFKAGARFLFQGDSITDMQWGRNQQDRNHYLGHSYCFLIASRLGVDMPKAKLEFFNRGISGNKVSDLRKRWQKDAVDINPDWLSILIGVNDVTRGGTNTLNFNKWEEDYRFILDRSQAKNPNVRIVLLDPFVLQVARLSVGEVWRHWRGTIDQLGEIVERIATDYGAVHIQTQKIFDQAAQKVSPQHWIWDGVHPLPQGHELIARNWLQAVTKATNKEA